jgi:hypothetical protein
VPDPRLPAPGVAATRRVALAGALGGALALAACDSDGPGAEPSTTSPTSTTTATEPAEDADAALVDDVVAELDELIAFTAAAAAARPEIAAWPTAFERLHRAHRAVLSDDTGQAEQPAVTGTPQAVVRLVTRREQAAQRRLADWSLAAQSGPLARLLASMSAAVAQQLAIPPTASGRSR